MKNEKIKPVFTNNEMESPVEYCEVCGGSDFWRYKYPLSLKPFLRREIYGALRRYFVNLIKFFCRILQKILPNFLPENIIKRAENSYKKIQSPWAVKKTIQGIKNGMRFFSGKEIFVCKECALGFVFPRIDSYSLTEMYKEDYWISGLGEIEPSENERTIFTYRLLSRYLDFSAIKKILEFGSGSAQLSRFFKSKEKNIFFDCVDPGLNWKSVLAGQIENVYQNIEIVLDRYDLIMGSHSLEHIPNLEKYFKKFLDLLNPNGYLYFEVPNSEERDLIFGEKPDFHFPHTYFFTQESFEQIAKKFELQIIFNKTFSRSYSQRFMNTDKHICSADENKSGAYIRVLMKKL